MIVVIFFTFSLALIFNSDKTLNYEIFGQNSSPNPVDEIGLSSKISGITCDAVEHLTFHNHTKLIIKDQNHSLTIPAGIGIVPNECIFWLHTHDDSGIIHIESPSEISFSLGQFLQVWNSFNQSSIIEEILQDKVQVDASILLENSSFVEPTTPVPDIPLQNNAIITLDLKNLTGP
ncbi:hypothetical protein [Candidatus Nitrosocosmicus franklandus]|nr:hypothetical protein [Candidatus Nitrosocosmicus franklandus]